jgi:hypothetical protein
MGPDGHFYDLNDPADEAFYQAACIQETYKDAGKTRTRGCLNFTPEDRRFSVNKEAVQLKAPAFCHKAAELMEDRGTERDQANGERSMARCVNAFNAMTGHALSVEDGWLFMVYLKHSRMRGGAFKLDDYEDAVAYEALMAEEAAS